MICRQNIWAYSVSFSGGQSDPVDWQRSLSKRFLLWGRAQAWLSLHLSLEVPVSELEVTVNFQDIFDKFCFLGGLMRWKGFSTYSSAPLYQLTWKSWPAQPPLRSCSSAPLFLCLAVNKGEQSFSITFKTVPQTRFRAMTKSHSSLGPRQKVRVNLKELLPFRQWREK